MLHKALYFHTPYCKTNCSYCVYDSNLAPQREINDYFDNKFISVVESLPFKTLLQNNTFEELYCGGGTPSIGSADQWRSIFERIPLNKIKMLCTECSPITVTPEHINLWGELKFTWVSMGVQSIHEALVLKNKRATLPIAELASIIEALNSRDIISNIDLICGLDNKDTRDVDAFIEEVKTSIDIINPVSLTLHVDMNIPTNTLTLMYVDLMNKLKALNGYKNYTCVNHDLNYSISDVQLNSEFRFMRDRKDFLFRQIAAAPTKLVKNWMTWKVSGAGVEQQSYDKEPLIEIIDMEKSWKKNKLYRDSLNLPTF